MKKSILATLATLFVAASAQALIIDLTPYAIQPNNSGNAITPVLTDAVEAYNDDESASLPLPIVSSFRNNQTDDNGPNASYPVFGNNVTSLSLPLGDFAYLVLHWGGPGGDHRNNNQPNYQFYYIGDPMGATSITVSNSDGHGLSWYEYLNPIDSPRENVPDSGTTALLLGSALALFAVARRRFVK